MSVNFVVLVAGLADMVEKVSYYGVEQSVPFP